MTEQLAIDAVAKAAAPEPKLKPQQAQAWEFIRKRDGVTALQVGAHVHARRTDGKQHSEGEPCAFCEQRGRSVVSSKALRPLVTYRNTGHGRVYIPRDPADRVAASKPSSGLIATSDPDPATNLFADL